MSLYGPSHIFCWGAVAFVADRAKSAAHEVAVKASSRGS